MAELIFVPKEAIYLVPENKRQPDASGMRGAHAPFGRLVYTYTSVEGRKWAPVPRCRPVVASSPPYIPREGGRWNDTTEGWRPACLPPKP